MIEKHYGHLASSVTDNFAKLLDQDEAQTKTIASLQQNHKGQIVTFLELLVLRLRPKHEYMAHFHCNGLVHECC